MESLLIHFYNSLVFSSSVFRSNNCYDTGTTALQTLLEICSKHIH